MFKLLLILSSSLLIACTTQKTEVSSSTDLILTKPLVEIDKASLQDICDSKNYNGCYQLGLYFIYKENDRVLAKKNFELACDQKIGLACFHLGTIIADVKPNQTEYDLEKIKQSISFFRKACDFGEYFSCLLMAEEDLNYLKSGNAKDQEKVEVAKRVAYYLSKSCSNNIETACKLVKNNFKKYPEYDTDKIKDMCRSGIIDGCKVPK